MRHPLLAATVSLVFTLAGTRTLLALILAPLFGLLATAILFPVLIRLLTRTGRVLIALHRLLALPGVLLIALIFHKTFGFVGFSPSHLTR